VYRATTDNDRGFLGNDVIRALEIFEANENSKPNERINSTT